MSEFDPDDDQRLRDLYHRAADDQPSAELDQRILAAASAATEQRRPRPWLPARGPLAGLATAAVVVLAVTLLLRQTEPPLPAEDAARERAAPTASRPPPDAAVAEEAAPERKSAFADTRSADVATTAAPRRRQEAMSAPGAAVVESTPEAAAGNVATLSADRDAVARRAATFAADGCREPYPLPAGAALRIDDGGLLISTDGERWRLRCVDGTWQREAVPATPQSSR